MGLSLWPVRPPTLSLSSPPHLLPRHPTSKTALFCRFDNHALSSTLHSFTYRSFRVQGILCPFRPVRSQHKTLAAVNRLPDRTILRTPFHATCNCGDL